MNKLKVLLPILIFALISCDLIINERSAANACDQYLFDRISEQGYLGLFIYYDMIYIDEQWLSEEEKEKQRAALQEMHSDFLKSLEGYNLSGKNKSRYRPWISVFVYDKEALTYVCKSTFVDEVVEDRLSTTN